MKSLTIKLKLSLLAGMIIIGFIGIGSIYAYSVDINADAKQVNQRVIGLELAVEQLKTGILQARRNEKDFLLRKDAKYVAKHKNTMADNKQKVVDIAVLLDDVAAKRSVEKLENLLGQYEASFGRVVDQMVQVGLNSKSGLLGELRHAVHEVESNLKKFKKDNMTVSMLMMRRHEKDYLARGAEKYVGKMAKRKAEFTTLLKNSNLPDTAKKRIASKMDSYHSSFLNLVAGKQNIAVEIEVFRDAVHAISPVLNEISDILEGVYNTNETLQAAKTQDVIMLMALTLLIVGAIVVVTVWWLGAGISRSLREAVGICEKIADGDLTADIQINNKDEIGQLMAALKSMSVKLSMIVGKVRGGTDNISRSSEEIAAGNDHLSQRTEQQASSLEETASSMEEMTSTVNQNADNARHANQIAAVAREQAEDGGDVVGRAVDAMGEINTSSKRIADIIGVIDEIAFQTNLLALNAAVEAARAGEQGRGFAVVAGEVRNLAQRSAEAAKEIKGLIQDSVGKVEQGSALVNESGQKLEQIVNSVKKVTDIVSEIAAASSEQATGIEQVNKAITQMDDMTQQNAALVEEAAAASKSMEEQATELSRQMKFFHLNSSELHSAVTPMAAGSETNTTERRGADRPFQGRPTEVPAHQVNVARTGSDNSEWKEF